MTDTSVVIIGGGVMGVSLLFHLTEAGWNDVVLFEKNDLTHGSTWHAAGLCTHFAHNATIQELRARSVRLYRDELPARTGESCGFHPCGAMRVTRNPDRMDEFKHVAGLSKFTGYELEVLNVDRIAQLHPLTKTDGLIGGIYEPDDGHVDPALATNAMANLAIKNGGTIKRYEPVNAIYRQNDDWIVETEKSSLRTTHVVNAAGTWGWEVGKLMGLNLPVVPVLHQYLVTETVPSIAQRIADGKSELPIIRDPEESWYLRQERDGFILGPYETDAKVWSADGIPPDFGADLLPPDLDRVEHIIAVALERVPSLGDAGVKTVVNGPITFTPDANPLVGPAHGLENAWLLTGSSMGVMEGGGAGWFLARWMSDGGPPMDANAIDSRRYGLWADRDYRINKAIECFGLQFGVHYPYEERPAARNKKLSPLHDAMLEKGAVMGVVNGWERPNWFISKSSSMDAGADAQQRDHSGVNKLSFKKPVWFDSVASEVHSVANKVALADLSALSKFMVSGAQTLHYLDTLGANKAPSPARAGLTHVLTPAGGVQSEFTVSVLDSSTAYLTSPSASERIDFDSLANHARHYDVQVHNISVSKSCIGLMGPLSRTVLSELTDADLENSFAWLHVRRIDVANVPVIAIRISYIGELGYELHVDNEHALHLFNALQAVGEKHDISYYGAYTANSMRLEKGYIAWSTELTSERTLEESGGDRFVKTQNRTFAGRDSLISRRDENAWRTVLMEIVSDQSIIDEAHAFHSHPVFQDDNVIGVITSAAYGHRCNKFLAFALLKEHTNLNRLSVEILGERCQALVLEFAPVDPTNERLMV